MHSKSIVAALAVFVAFAFTACSEDKKPEAAKPPPTATDKKPEVAAPPTPPADVQPAKVVEIQGKLKDAGLTVVDVKPLRGNTMPGCKEEFRSRLYVGEPGKDDFLNVARFATAEDAAACLEIYKAAVMKGGQAAWDRLGPLVSTNGAWFYMFSESMTDGARRDKILAEVKKVE